MFYFNDQKEQRIRKEIEALNEQRKIDNASGVQQVFAINDEHEGHSDKSHEGGEADNKL